MGLRRPHLVYLAWGFPPSRGGGVYRALATANRAAAVGFDVTVVTATEETFRRYTGTDDSLLERLDPAVEVVRVDFPWPARDVRLTGSRVPDLVRRVRRRLLVLRSRAEFPETHYGSWLPALTAAVEQVHRRRHVDLCVATANPHVTLAAAHLLHRRHGVPYVVDYRDGWSLDVFTGAELFSPRSRAGRWETRILADAAEAWFVNTRIRDWYAERYPAVTERMHVVRNGWDPEFLAPEPPAPGTHRPLTFGYLGTISAKVPVRELAEGWLAAVDRLPTGARLVLAGYRGFFDGADQRVERLLAEASAAGMDIEDPVPKAEVGRFYASVDVLVLALGTGRYVTSGKVYEYLATGKPVVAVHHPDNASSEVLAGRDAVLLPESLEPDAIATALVAAAEVATGETSEAVAARRAAAEDLRRDRQLDPRLQAWAARLGDG